MRTVTAIWMSVTSGRYILGCWDEIEDARRYLRDLSTLIHLQEVERDRWVGCEVEYTLQTEETSQ